MKFEYSNAPQKSPEWFALRRGKVTASRLEDWLSVSKSKDPKVLGKPLKKRLDYEKELMFERQFNTNFETYVNSAMQDGIDYEDFARKQYEKATDCTVQEVGCWYNDYFVASPDGLVIINGKDEGDGLVEIKILKDNSFTEVLVSGVPDKHWKQIQGQLWASNAEWCDYIALNFNTRKFVIIRVLPDKEFFEYLELAIPEELVTQQFAITNVHDVVGELPSELDESTTLTSGGDW